MDKNLDDTSCQYLVNERGERVGVLLSIENHKKILRELEDCRDALLADQAYEEFTRGRTLEESIVELLEKKDDN